VVALRRGRRLDVVDHEAEVSPVGRHPLVAPRGEPEIHELVVEAAAFRVV
jgi:hypothetical protein